MNDLVNIQRNLIRTQLPIKCYCANSNNMSTQSYTLHTVITTNETNKMDQNLSIPSSKRDQFKAGNSLKTALKSPCFTDT